MKLDHLVLVISLAAFSTACKNDAPTSDSAPKGATSAKIESGAAAKHAATNVTPGSHEDWCEEHQVPESQCTKCNPALIAAFKATGDWCSEHGLPESQCRLCNPDLKIERPAKREGPK